MREKIEVVAKSKEEAIEKALAELNTTRDKVNVRIIDEGSKGLFGFGAKDAKIVVTMKDELEIKAAEELEKQKQKAEEEKKQEEEAKAAEKAEKEAAKAAEKAAKKAEEAEKIADLPVNTPVSVSEAEVVKKATEFVKVIVSKMSPSCGVTSKIEDNGIRVVITGEDVGNIIGRRGETLDAIQYITNLHVNKGRHGDDYKRITVDTESYRAKREETLVHLAHGAASKVVKTKRDYPFEPMNPYERRIIHATLQNHKYVKTRSVGEEPNRRIIISLKK